MIEKLISYIEGVEHEAIGAIGFEEVEFQQLKSRLPQIRKGVRPNGLDLLLIRERVFAEQAEWYRFALGGRGRLLLLHPESVCWNGIEIPLGWELLAS